MRLVIEWQKASRFLRLIVEKRNWMFDFVLLRTWRNAPLVFGRRSTFFRFEENARARDLVSLISARGQTKSRIFDRILIVKWFIGRSVDLSIPIFGTENNESAGHALKCRSFLSSSSLSRADDVQYLTGWWALLTFKNIIFKGHCIQKSIYELIS